MNIGDRFRDGGKTRVVTGHKRFDDGTEYDISRVVIRCCGAELVCDGFTNTCEHCGADYNMSGDQLAPRSQWGEETGESVADILRADIDSDRDDY